MKMNVLLIVQAPAGRILYRLVKEKSEIKIFVSDASGKTRRLDHLVVRPEKIIETRDFTHFSGFAQFAGGTSPFTASLYNGSSATSENGVGSILLVT